MGTKSDYKKANKDYLRNFSKEENVIKLEDGVLIQSLNNITEGPQPNSGNIVVVHYKGMFIDGTEFDSSYSRSCPDALRLRDTIEGWQIAIPNMHKGEKCKVVIPATVGYGNKKVDDIPGNSTLIFEIELIDIH